MHALEPLLLLVVFDSLLELFGLAFQSIVLFWQKLILIRWLDFSPCLGYLFVCFIGELFLLGG